MAIGTQTFDPSQVLVMVLAGGEGKRLYPLTLDRAKPAVPFAGRYRIVRPIAKWVMLGVSLIQIAAQIGATWYGARASMSFGRDVRNGIFARALTFSAREVSIERIRACG